MMRFDLLSAAMAPMAACRISGEIIIAPGHCECVGFYDKVLAPSWLGTIFAKSGAEAPDDNSLKFESGERFLLLPACKGAHQAKPGEH